MENPLIRFIKTLVYNGLEAFGRYYSNYRAFVSDVNDPENLQRLKLIIPQLSGTQAYNYWAYPKGVFFGEKYGSQVLPQRGDMVWVEFEGGAPEIPIWSHGHPSRKELSKDPDLKDVRCYWFMTPKGNLIKLYDTKNLIHIRNSLGHYHEINENGHSVVSNQHIYLGSLNTASESAVLGDTLEKLLKDFTTDVGNMTVAGTKIKTAPEWALFLTKWLTKWNEFKSTKVKLD